MRRQHRPLRYRVGAWPRHEWQAFGEVGGTEHDAMMEDGQKRTADWDAFPTEVFGRLYSEYTEALDPAPEGTEWAKSLHEAAEEIPEWGRLAKRVYGDSLMAGVATVAICRELAKAMPEPETPAESAQQALATVDMAKTLELPLPKEQMEYLENEARQAIDQNNALAPSTDDARLAMRAAIASATDAVNKTEKLLAAAGMGTAGAGQGSSGRTAKNAKLEAFARLQNSDKMRRIADLAGRMRNLAMTKQRGRYNGIPEQIVDVGMTRKPQDATIGEMAMLSCLGGRAVFANKAASGSLTCLERGPNDERGAGPIVIAMDESGSMRGAFEIWCKAVAMGLMEIARHQKRTFAAISFNTKITHEMMAPKGQASPDEIMEMVEHFSGGGTKFEPPIARALEIVETDKILHDADIVLVTDGRASLDDETRGRLARLMTTTNTDLYVIVIGGGSAAGLGDLATGTWKMTTTEDGDPILAEVFTIGGSKTICNRP